MKRGEVISLQDHKERRRKKAESGATGATKGVPYANSLAYLLDRNISLEIWKKGI